MQTKVGPAFVLWDVMSCPLPTEEEQNRRILANIRTAVFTHCSCTGINPMMAIGANYIPAPIANLLYAAMFLAFCLPEFQEWKMISEMRYWAKRNPAPATYLVISGNKALSSTLETLHRRNYNILVAHPDSDGHSTDLAATASCVWNFTSLLHGEPPYLVRKEMVPRIFAFPQPEVGTFVLWDVRSCPLPTDESKCLDIVDNIYFAVFANCSCTDITMKAVGTNDYPRPILDLLFSDMSLVSTLAENHVTKMIYEMNRWAKSNPVPANILVISGDASLSPALEKLQSRNYNILVAHPHPCVHSADLVATASRVWHFESLLCGKSPYFARTEMVLHRAEEPCKETPAAIVRPKKKTKYQHLAENQGKIHVFVRT